MFVCVIRAHSVSQCKLLQGLEAVDLRDDPDALEELRARVAPVLGGMLEDDQVVKVEGEERRGPWLDLIIASMVKDSSGERVYVALDCAVLVLE